MKIRIILVLLFLCAAARAQFTLTVNPQGKIVAPVTPNQFQIANGFTNGSTNGAGISAVSNFYGSTGINASYVLTNALSQLYLSNYFNTNGSGGGLNAVFYTNLNGTLGGVYAYTNSQGALVIIQTNNNFTPGTDTRPFGDVSTKAATGTNGVPYPIFSISSPCTIVGLDMGDDHAPNNVWPSDTVTFVIDGTTQTCSVYGLYAAYGFTAGHHAENLTWAPSMANAESYGAAYGAGFRTMAINVYTNCTISFTPRNGAPIYSDTRFKLGNPTVSNAWRVLEFSNNLAPNTTLSITATTNVGQVESLVLFRAGTNGPQYLENTPNISLDSALGVPPITANGGENFFGGAWYYSVYGDQHNDQHWGVRAGPLIYGLRYIGYTDGDCAYRFFPEGAYYSKSLAVSVTNNSATDTILAMGCLTYFTNWYH